MSKFCGKCGSKLDENTGLCPNCDNKTTKYDDDFSFYSEAEFNNISENDRKKSVGKKGHIATLVTVWIALVVIAVILICSLLNTINYKSDKNESTSKNSEEYAYSESVAKSENTNSEKENSPQSDALSDNSSSSNHDYDNSNNIETAQQYTENDDTNTSVNENSHTNDYSQYVGRWHIVYPNGNGAVLWVEITDVKDNKMTFELGRTSPNYAHIAMTEKITAEINPNNEVNFVFTDSFSNDGTGYMKLNDDNIYLKTEITRTNQPYIYALTADDTLTRAID